MRNRWLAVVASSVLLASTPCTGGPDTGKGPVIHKLPKGQTAESFRKLVEAASVRWDAEQAAEARQLDALLRAIADATGAERKRIAGVLEKDPRYASLREETKRIAADKGSWADKYKRRKAATDKYRSLAEETIRATALDEAAVRAKFAKIAKDLRLLGGLGVGLKTSTGSRASTAAPAGDALVLTPPYSFSNETGSHQGATVANGTADANVATGSAAVSAAAEDEHDGYSTAEAVVGEYFEVPSSFGHATVTVSLSVSYEGTAWGTPNHAAVFAETRVSVANVDQTTGAPHQNQVDDDSEYVSAPAGMASNGTALHVFSFPVPPHARQYFVTAGAHVWVHTSDGGGGSVTAKATVTQIRVTFTP